MAAAELQQLQRLAALQQPQRLAAAELQQLQPLADARRHAAELQRRIPFFRCSSGEKQENGSINKGKYKKTRRGGKSKNNSKTFKVIGVNANGLTSKITSLDYIINSLDPSVFMIQETKMKKAWQHKD